MPTGSTGSRKALIKQFSRQVFLEMNTYSTAGGGYQNLVYDCIYNPIDDAYYIAGFLPLAIYRIKNWAVQKITTGARNEMLAVDKNGDVWFSPTYTSAGVDNPRLSRYNRLTGTITTFDLSGYPNFQRGSGIAYDADRDRIVVLGTRLLVELDLNGTVTRTLAMTNRNLEGILINRDLAYITDTSASLTIVNLTTFTEISVNNLSTLIGISCTLGGEKFSWHYYQNMPILIMYVRMGVSTIGVNGTIIVLLASDGKSIREVAIIANGSDYLQRLPKNLAAVESGILNYMTGDFMYIPQASVGVDWDGENVIYAQQNSYVSPYASYFNITSPNLSGRYKTSIPLLSNKSIAAGGVATPAIWTQWCEQVTFNFLSRTSAGTLDIEYWDEQADTWLKYATDVVVVAGTPNVYPAGGSKKMMRLWTNLSNPSACDLQVNLR